MGVLNDDAENYYQTEFGIDSDRLAELVEVTTQVAKKAYLGEYESQAFIHPLTEALDKCNNFDERIVVAFNLGKIMKTISLI